MARTQAADYEQRRGAILEEAAKLFATHGFLGASVVELAKACKVSKSLLYHYYPSKESILFDVMDSHIHALTGVAEATLAGEAPPTERLRALTRAFMQLYSGASGHHKVLLNELDNLSREQRDLVVDHQRRLLRLVEHVLLEIEPSLERDRTRLRPVVMLFFGMINWTHNWFNPSGALSQTQVADMAVDILIGGLHSIK
ncbi:MAG: TetR family transcriptional regulator [Rubritepida sp.]|nr:TetR family transcriptional regulator [Rubritepida sp.]